MRVTLTPPNEQKHFEWIPYLYGDEVDIMGVEKLLHDHLGKSSMNREQFVKFLFDFCITLAKTFNSKLGYEESTLQMGAVIIHKALLKRALEQM